MEKKKKPNWFKGVFGICFVVYFSLYILNGTGYYDGNMRRKVKFTESQIKKFEEDIALGEVIDLKDYLKDQNIDYTNKASDLGYVISTGVDTFLNKGIRGILSLIGKMLS